ncbi:hypothetical protein CSUI_007231 [Cystoisospora suis]|uniref:Uncharacterized protein n=1 Tax=Cystoisospora suis TaxID=483139 RepID=A0A2C6KRB8_9APIC|nr:hypothetical protein CSUI_007231 [Cystoisospora suis]
MYTRSLPEEEGRRGSQHTHVQRTQADLFLFFFVLKYLIRKRPLCLSVFTDQNLVFPVGTYTSTQVYIHLNFCMH